MPYKGIETTDFACQSVENSDTIVSSGLCLY